MLMKTSILMFFIDCQEIYRDVRSLEQDDYSEMIDRIENSKMFEYHKKCNYFEVLRNKYELNIKDVILETYTLISDSCFSALLGSCTRLLDKILNSIMNREFDEVLIKLICRIKVENHSRISIFSFTSVYISTTICEILDLLSNEDYIIKNKQESINKLQKNCNSYESNLVADKFSTLSENKMDDEFFLLKFWEIIYLKNTKQFFKNYACRFNSLEEERTFFDFYYFIKKFHFYSSINETICKYESEENKHSSIRNVVINIYDKYFQSNKNDYYRLYISISGASFDKISKHPLKNEHLQREGKLINFKSKNTRSLIISDKLDLKFMKNITFRSKGRNGFEFIMGLLQYYAESQFVNMTCLYEKNSYYIKVTDVYDGIEHFLDFYKLDNNITHKFIRTLENDEEGHFITEVESKKYYFSEREGYEKHPNCKCLVLSCKHIVGKELLEEFFRINKMMCSQCKIEVRVTGYIEIDLYSARDESMDLICLN